MEILFECMVYSLIITSSISVPDLEQIPVRHWE